MNLGQIQLKLRKYPVNSRPVYESANGAYTLIVPVNKDWFPASFAYPEHITITIWVDDAERAKLKEEQ